MTLVEFLRARLDEDDEVARATRRFEQRVPHTERWFASHGDAITSMAPHRAVAEVDAKRRLITTIVDVEARADGPDNIELSSIVADSLLRLLALPYADHRDYDEAWRPA